MYKHPKRVLIVDDSEIDREILRNIISAEFEVLEADNGHEALKILNSGAERVDALIMDILMPDINGLTVLSLLDEPIRGSMPIFLITSEATKTNVKKAAGYRVSSFIMKPFDGRVILSRLKSALGSFRAPAANPDISEQEFLETDIYIQKLKTLFDGYLESRGMSKRRYERVSASMGIMMKELRSFRSDLRLNQQHIDIVSRAAYFYDIGVMTVPDAILDDENGRSRNALYQKHTVNGAKLIHLNGSKNCSYFTAKCGEICLHHHERWDGTGYPHGLLNEENSYEAQLCALAITLDGKLELNDDYSEEGINYAIRDVIDDGGMCGEGVMTVFKNSKYDLADYYTRLKR